MLLALADEVITHNVGCCGHYDVIGGRPRWGLPRLVRFWRKAEIGLMVKTETGSRGPQLGQFGDKPTCSIKRAKAFPSSVRCLANWPGVFRTGPRPSLA